MTAAHVNRVRLVGRAGQDAETKTLQDGQVILRLRLCTETVAAEWHSVEYGGPDARRAAKAIRRGDTVAIEGCLRTRCFERGGEKRYVMDVVAVRVVRVLATESRGAK